MAPQGKQRKDSKLQVGGKNGQEASSERTKALKPSGAAKGKRSKPEFGFDQLLKLVAEGGDIPESALSSIEQKDSTKKIFQAFKRRENKIREEGKNKTRKLESLTRTMGLLYELSGCVGKSTTLKELIHRFVIVISKNPVIQGGALYLFNSNSDTLKPEQTFGKMKKNLRDLEPLQPDDKTVRKILASEDALKTRLLTNKESRGKNSLTEISLPLKSEEENLGILTAIINDGDENAEAFLVSASSELAVGIKKKKTDEEVKQSHEELSKREALYSTLVNTTEEAIILSDAKEKILYANPAASRLLGYSKEELESLYSYDLIGKDERDRLKKENSLRVKGKASKYELTLRSKNGKPRHMLITASPVFDSKGVFYASLAALTDITEIKQTETKLKESEEKHRLLMDSIRSPVLALKEDMTILYCNESFAEFTGKDVRELEGQRLLDIFPKYRNTVFHQAFKEVLKTGKPLESDGRIGNSYLHVRVYRAPWGIVSVAEDITQKKLQDETLREREELYRKLVDTAREGIILTDLKEKMLFVNPMAAEMLGYDPEELIGRSVLDFIPKDHKRNILEQTIKRTKGETSRYETALAHKGGPHRKVLITGAPILDSNDRISSTIAIMTDITEISVINEITQAISSTLDVKQIYRVIHDQLKRLINADNFYIALYDAETDEVSFPYAFQDGTLQGWTTRRGGKGMTEYVIKTGEPQLFKGTSEKEATRRGVEHIGKSSLSWLGVPMIVRNRVIGVMTVQSFDQNVIYSEKHISIMQTIATQAAQAVENARAYSELERKLTELSVFNEIGRALTSTLKFDELMNVLYKQASRIMDTESFYVALYDEKTNVVEFPLFMVDEGKRIEVPSKKFGKGLTEFVVTSRKSLFIRENVVENAKQLGIDMYVVAKTMPKCWLGVPMISHNKVLGVIAVQSTRKPNVYNENNQRLLEAIANQAAGAVANARAYSELERKLTELSAFNEISRALGSTLRLDELMDVLYNQTSRIMDTESFYTALYNKDANTVEFPLFKASDGTKTNIPPREFGDGLTEYVISSRKPLLLDEAVLPNAKKLGINVKVVVNEAVPQSWLGAPMIFHDNVVGVIAVQNTRKTKQYNESHQKFLEAIANQAAGAVSNARTYSELEAKLTELSVFKEIGQALGSTLRLDELLEVMYTQITRIMENDSFYISLYDDKARILEFPFYVVDGNPAEISPRPFGKGLTEYVIKMGKPLIFGENMTETELELGIAPVKHGKDDNPLSWLGVPMISHDKVIGVIGMQSKKANTYNEDHKRIIASIANQAAQAVENARAYMKLEERLTERSVMSEISRAIGSTLKSGELMEVLYNQIHRIMMADSFYLALYNSLDNSIEFPFFIENGKPLDVPSRPFGEGLTEYVIKSKEPLLLQQGDFEVQCKRLGIKMVLHGAPPISWLGVPMISQNRVLGVLAVQSVEKKYSYDENHKSMLSAIANQAAGAVDNARTYEALERRLTELSVLNEIGRALGSTLDIDYLMTVVHAQTSRIMDSDNLYIALYDENSRTIEFPFFMDSGKKIAMPSRKLGGGLTDYVIKTCQSLLIHEDVEKETSRLGIDMVVAGKTPKCWLGVPMISQDKVIGVMSVQNTSKSRMYDENHKRLLESIANQAAGAAANARAYAALERKLTELSVFNEIGRALASTIQLDELLKVMYTQIIRIMEGEAFYIALYDENTGMIEFPIWAEKGEFKQVHPRKFSKGMTEYVIGSRKSLLFGENMQEEEKNLGIESYNSGDQSYSWLGAPMISQDKVLGIIAIQSTKKSIYDEGHKKLLESIANQAAGAVANARAFAMLERRGDELRELLKTSTDLSSTLDEIEVGHIIAERATGLIPSDGCTFYRFDKNANKLIPLASNVIEEYEQRMAYSIPLGDGVTGKAALQREPILANNVHKDPNAPRLPGTKELPTCILASPLLARGELLGAMTLLRLSENEFTDHDLQLFSLFARQAADAFANSLFISELRLLNEDMERRNAERQVLLETSSAASSSLDEKEVALLISEKAADFLKADGCTYYQYDDESGELIPQTTTMAEGQRQILKHRIKLNEGITGRAAAERKAIMANNIHLDIDAKRIPDTKELPTSLLSVPLAARGELLGVMTLTRFGDEAFTQHNLELFNLFARQVTDSIANSRLFGRLRQLNKDLQNRSDELSALFNTSTELSSVLDDEEAGNLIAARAIELVQADGCTFYTYDQKSELLVPVTTTLIEEYEQRMTYKVPLGEGITGKAALERRPIMANNVHQDPEVKRVPGTKDLPTCLLVTPLVARGELVGAMTLIRLSEKGFEEHDLQLFTLFGRQAAEVFTNSRLFGQLRELNENLEKIVTERTGELEKARRDLEAVHEEYTKRVRTRLTTIAPIMEKISIGDFSENIPLPEIEDEFTELFVGLNLMIDDLRFMFEENRRRSEETRRRSEELSTLLDTSTAISSSLYEDEVSQIVAEKAISLIKADRCNVYRFDPEKNELVPQTTTEVEQRKQIMDFKIPLGLGAVGKAASERTPQLANNIHKDPTAPRIPGTAEQPTCIMAAPLIVQRELLGVMALSRLSEESFSEHDMELFLLFSRQVAETTANARLFGKLKELNENLEIIVNQRTKELEESNRKTAAFARELEEVIYVTSHDLKTPLRAISGFSQFLYEDYKDKIGPEGRLYLTRLIDSAKRMEKLLDDLLNISAITRKERVFEHIPAGELIVEALKLINPGADSEVIYDPETLPTVFCDRTKLVEVFYNLISNGLKFNDKPRKKVTVTARDSDGFHEFTLEDNGIGIEKRHYERIFKIFQRLHLREEYEGTGVGLSMVKRVLEEHNGRIWVESQVGVGTIFHFTLPHHKVDELGETENLERSP